MKKQRNLDGYRYRILRNGEYKIVCISDMNEKEIDKILSNSTKATLLAMTKGLANKLYQYGEEYNIKR